MRDPEPVTYLAWARAAAEARVRFIVMDFIGTPLEGKTLPAANAFLAAIGLSVRPVWVEASPDLRLVLQSDTMLVFERKLDGDFSLPYAWPPQGIATQRADTTTTLIGERWTGLRGWCYRQPPSVSSACLAVPRVAVSDPAASAARRLPARLVGVISSVGRAADS